MFFTLHQYERAETPYLWYQSIFITNMLCDSAHKTYKLTLTLFILMCYGYGMGVSLILIALRDYFEYWCSHDYLDVVQDKRNKLRLTKINKTQWNQKNDKINTGENIVLNKLCFLFVYWSRLTLLCSNKNTAVILWQK